MKIAICSPEVFPFAKTGGLADVAGALPLVLEELGEEVAVVMPAYKCVRQAGADIRKLNKDVSFSVIGGKTKIYFLENEKLFSREGVYGDKHGDYPDNLERFSFYCQGALKLLKEIGFAAEIIHLHDWQACLIPVYLKEKYLSDDFYRRTKTLLTIHNLGYQGIFPKEEFVKLGLDKKTFGINGLEYYGKINLLKGGLLYADLINTVSPAYSREIQSEELGFGLQGILKSQSNRIFGILNGVDYKIWDPRTDRHIARNYSVVDPGPKGENKAALQKICGFKADPGVPLFAIVSRLAEQKGFDILSEAIDAICAMRLQLVILGEGEEKYRQLLRKAAKKHAQSISVHFKFDEPLAHQIYAGADIFVMPSRYEPCGLGQLIAYKYGAIPLVFKTGGLADTVTNKSGFVFERYHKDDLIREFARGVEAFRDKKSWAALMRQAMQFDYSWVESGKKYLELYRKAAEAR
jgi:starch synthase